VLGDETYGAADPAIDRPLLHAAVLGFVHPATREYVEHHAPLPGDMARAVAARRPTSATPSQAPATTCCAWMDS
jgi:23S rRNA pseudouridine1911/1915/1917 synthase